MYGRTYMRRQSFGNQLVAVKWLLIVNVAAFILQVILESWFRSSILEKYFALSQEALKSGKIWTLVTYSFLHGGFLHILLNMLAIFFVGRILEPNIGSKNLLKVYFVSVLIGGLSWLLLAGGHGQVLVGASAGGFGLMTFFCLMFPETYITVLVFFIIPITMKPKWILWAMIAIEGFIFLVYELPGNSIMASSGHLGGILAGAIMFQLLIKHRLFSFGKINIEAPKWLKRTKSPKISNPKFKLNLTEKQNLKKEVDRILDKINQQGFSSLNPQEKEILDKAHTHLNAKME